MVDPEYGLIWPKTLFKWEAERIIHLPDETVAAAFFLLLDEAYRDPDVAIRYADDTSAVAGPFAGGATPMHARGWISTLLHDEERLRPYIPPRYWAERNGHVGGRSSTPMRSLGEDVVRLIDRFQDEGYFPKLMPRDCVDNHTEYGSVSEAIEEATHLPIEWPILPSQLHNVREETWFTLIEFFHDHAQRPRTFDVHTFNDCGRHFHNPDRTAGGAVYRWRINELLERHDVPLRLGTKGIERGRLVRHFGSGLDALAEAQVAEDAAAPNATAEAVRMYRERDASLPQKRSALNLLAGELERRRQTVKAVLKEDEAALFNIANNYALRHQRDGQRDDYGPELLDWVFWSFLAAVDLMNRLEQRGD